VKLFINVMKVVEWLHVVKLFVGAYRYFSLVVVLMVPLYIKWL